MTKTEKLTRRFNAYNEVYEILNHLEKEEYKRIPKKLIDTIDNFRNKEHEFQLNEALDLNKQEMLPETKAILFNIFRDYLSTEEQKQKIKFFQKQDLEVISRKRIENSKINRESQNKFDEIINKTNDEIKVSAEDNVVRKEQALVKLEKDSFLKQVINRIKSFFVKHK